MGCHITIEDNLKTLIRDYYKGMREERVAALFLEDKDGIRKIVAFDVSRANEMQSHSKKRVRLSGAQVARELNCAVADSRDIIFVHNHPWPIFFFSRGDRQSLAKLTAFAEMKALPVNIGIGIIIGRKMRVYIPKAEISETISL